MATNSAATEPRESKPGGRIVPPLWYWLFLLIVIGLNVWAAVSEDIDRAIANVIAMASGFAVPMVLLVWFALRSGHSPRLRWTPLGIVLGALAISPAIIRIDHWTDELLPKFTWRWSPPYDETLAKLAAAEHPPKVPLDVTTDDDFPQFLGPERNLGIDRVTLARDWKTPPRLLWKHPIGAGHSAFSAVNGYAVTMEQRGEDELVTCYDLLTGELKWSSGIQARHATSFGGVGPRSTPTIHAGKVYAMGATGILRCLDGTTGSLLWSKDLLQETGVSPANELSQIAWGRAGSPLIVDNLVVVPGGGPKAVPLDPDAKLNPSAPAAPAPISLLAYDRESGKRIWQAGSHQVSYASPALARLGGVRQIISVNEDNISGHNAASGAVLWEFPWPGRSNYNANSSQAIAVADDRVFVSKGYSGGSSLFAVNHDAAKDTWATAVVWHNVTNMQTKMSNVVVDKGFVYGLSDSILECIELATGKRRWKGGHYGEGQILRVRDLLLVVSHNGKLFLLELTPEARHELGSFQALDGDTWNNLCLYDRYLLLRNSEEAACYELPLEGPSRTAAK